MNGTSFSPQVDAHLGTTMSFRELLVQTVLAAEGWKSMGLGKGDVLALVSRNQHEVFPAVLGAMVAGITVACAVPSATPCRSQAVARNCCSVHARSGPPAPGPCPSGLCDEVCGGCGRSRGGQSTSRDGVAIILI